MEASFLGVTYLSSIMTSRGFSLTFILWHSTSFRKIRTLKSFLIFWPLFFVLFTVEIKILSYFQNIPHLLPLVLTFLYLLSSELRSPGEYNDFCLLGELALSKTIISLWLSWDLFSHIQPDNFLVLSSGMTHQQTRLTLGFLEEFLIYLFKEEVRQPRVTPLVKERKQQALKYYSQRGKCVKEKVIEFHEN